MPFEKQVIDVSVYQGEIDWPQVAGCGIYGAVLRAGYGREVSQEDRKFRRNYAGAVGAGLPVGAYWFSYAKDPADAENEARACLEVLDGRQLELPLYFDQEESSIPAAQRTLCALAFCRVIRENSGYRVGYYSYTSYFPSLDLAAIQSAFDTIWLADYRANYDKTIPRDMHQYTSNGSVPGISGRVDMNRLFRDFLGEEKEEEMDLSFDTYKIGPVSEGDRRAMAAFAEGLGIGYSHEGDYILIGPASLGDRKQLLAKAQSLGLGIEGVAPQEEPEEPSSGEDKPSTGEGEPEEGTEGGSEGQNPGESGSDGQNPGEGGSDGQNPGESGSEGQGGGSEGDGEKNTLTLTGAGPAQAELIKALAGLWGLAVKEGGE